MSPDLNNKSWALHHITLTDTPSCHFVTASLLTAFQDLYDFAALLRYGENKKEKEKRKGKKRDGGHYGHGVTAGTAGAAVRCKPPMQCSQITQRAPRQPAIFRRS